MVIEYNYGNFIRAFEKGVANPDMTNLAKTLFKPVVDAYGVKNQNKNLYTIDSKVAKKWYDYSANIPEKIREAISNDYVIKDTIKYFEEEIDGVYVHTLKQAAMYEALIPLIQESNLATAVKKELLELLAEGKNGEFLAKAFLHSLLGNNQRKPSEHISQAIDDDLAQFHSLIRKCKKPKALTPPKEIADKEFKYVNELYRVYSDFDGETYVQQSDIESNRNWKRDFDRHRVDFYKAETIRMELRDTIRLDEEEGFELLKDEMYDGVITTRDKSYDKAYNRLTAVMEQATNVQISQNLKRRLLDWVGPGEKKGVCHMLVNDDRLSWMEEEDDE